MTNRNEAFEAGLKSLGRTLTPEDLQNKGVRKVKAVKTQVLIDLIESAVNRTVLQQTTDMLPATRQRLLRQARLELDRLVGLRDHLEDARQTLRQAQQYERTPTLDYRAAVQGCMDSFRERVSSLFDRAGEAKSAKDEMMKAASEVLHKAAQEVARAKEREMDLLRGRIRKLLGTLEGTESALDEVLSHMGGRKSGFRESQRVTENDHAGRERMGMMAGLFEQNRRIQPRETEESSSR